MNDLLKFSSLLTRCIAIAAVLCMIFITGCHSAMSTSHIESRPGPDSLLPHMVPPPGHGPYTGTVADWPLWFVQHNFGAYCYETYGCKVQYNGFNHVNEPNDILQISSASIGSKYPANLKAGYLGIRNFPSPAIVTWRSKDGESHSMDVDIGEIFKDRLVRHNVPREDIPSEIGLGETNIILEVNNRTINVYTRTHVPAKHLQIPGNRYSDFRDDLICVFTKTY